MPGLDLDCDRRQLLALAALCVLVLLAGCGRVQHTQYRACAVCDEAYNATDHDFVNAQLDVQLYANGSARWTARIDQTSDVPGERAALAERLAASVRDEKADDDRIEPAHEGRARAVRSTVRDETIVVTFRVPDVSTERPFGYRTVESFHLVHDQQSDRAYTLGARTVRLHAPEGTAFTNGPDAARVADDGRTLVWTAGLEGRDTAIDGSTYVVVSPDRSLVRQAGGVALLGWLTLQWSGQVLLVAVPTIVLTVLLWLLPVIHWTTDRDVVAWLADPGVDLDRRQARAVAAAAGGLVILYAASFEYYPRGDPAAVVVGLFVLGTPVLGGVLGSAIARDRWYTAPTWVLLVGFAAAPALLFAVSPSSAGPAAVGRLVSTNAASGSAFLGLPAAIAFLIAGRIETGEWLHTGDEDVSPR